MSDPIALLTLACAALAVVLLLVNLYRTKTIADPEAARRELRDELRSARDEARGSARELREEVTKSIDATQASLDRVRGTLDQRVRELQEGNERKLDEMRRTVDEKLHDTLEKRLGESFKRVLTNVKARGTWAEVQLGAILEQVLTPDQFSKNVSIRPDTAERVEFAVRLPGPLDDPASCVWLPIDSKFPQEDWLRLQDASDHGDVPGVQAASDALIRTVRGSAKEIHDKYVHPPASTDFAIMFLATEGLFAEVLRHPSVVSDLQQQYRVVVAGPTTLAAILTSLRMGFQTLVVEQRAAEVWRVLGAVKTEFGKFGDVLDKVQRQLTTASRTIEETGQRSRAMEKKLRSAERLPDAEAAMVLELPVGDTTDTTDASLPQ